MMGQAQVASLYRHPVKGFTPESVDEAVLIADGFFPFDRLYALEVGPCGFDPATPKTISKMKFAVLARFPSVARLNTRYNEVSHRFEIHQGADSIVSFNLKDEGGAAELAHFVEAILAQHEDYDPVVQPLNLLQSPESAQPFRFTDSGKGFVSFLNLNSLRDLSGRVGMDLDPLRLRANMWVEGWEPFADHDWVGRTLRLGDDGPEFEVLKPIVRCIATHVNPQTAERDIDLCTALWENYGHRDCGIYGRVIKGGVVRPGDALHLVA